MNYLRGYIAVFGVAALLSTHYAEAISLALAPSAASVSLGDAVNVDVNIAGLASGGPPSVGAFDLDVAFDPSVLSPTGVAFGPFLGNPLLFEALTDFKFSTPGIVDFAEVSLLSPFELDVLQPATFSLATLSFTAIGSGTSQFNFAGDIRVDDPFGNKLSISIPEPATVILLGLGFIALCIIRRPLRHP